MTYDSIADYLNLRCTTDALKIAALQDIYSQLLVAVAEAATRGAIREYSLDSGQSKVETKYRSVTEMVNSMKALEALITMYINRNSRTRQVRLVPAQSPYRRNY